MDDSVEEDHSLMSLSIYVNPPNKNLIWKIYLTKGTVGHTDEQTDGLMLTTFYNIVVYKQETTWQNVDVTNAYALWIVFQCDYSIYSLVCLQYSYSSAL